MKAMILAAGLGTRLYPLTNDKPKALVEVNGIPLIEMLIKRLIKFNVNEIIINVHHYPEQLMDYIKRRNYYGIRIEFSEESGKLLDTGGGLKKASWFFNDNNPFLVHNVDILSTIDFDKLFGFHDKHRALATVCVKKRQSTRYLMFDKNNNLCGRRNVKTGEHILTNDAKETFELAFSGIHVINPEIFTLINEEGAFSIIDLYLRLSKNHRIVGYQNEADVVIDVGKPENLKKAGKLFNVH